MKKSIKYVLMLLVFVVVAAAGILATDVKKAEAMSIYEGYPIVEGRGTEKDPFIITRVENLWWISENINHWPYYFAGDRCLNKACEANHKHYFKLDCDIDFADDKYMKNKADNDKFFYPIGRTRYKFNGVFDGNGHTIKNFRSNYGLSDFGGLFGNLDGATIKNVKFENVYIEGLDFMGAIAGQAVDSKFYDITVTGEIHSLTDAKNVGAIAGRAENCEFKNVTVKVKGTKNAIAGTAIGCKMSINNSLSSIFLRNQTAIIIVIVVIVVILAIIAFIIMKKKNKEKKRAELYKRFED